MWNNNARTGLQTRILFFISPLTSARPIVREENTAVNCVCVCNRRRGNNIALQPAEQRLHNIRTNRFLTHTPRLPSHSRSPPAAAAAAATCQKCIHVPICVRRSSCHLRNTAGRTVFRVGKKILLQQSRKTIIWKCTLFLQNIPFPCCRRGRGQSRKNRGTFVTIFSTASPRFIFEHRNRFKSVMLRYSRGVTDEQNT